MKRCHMCFSRYPLADFAIHIESHHLNNGTIRQYRSTQRTLTTGITKRHAPNEECNCRAYGVRDYCELLQLEVA